MLAMLALVMLVHVSASNDAGGLLPIAMLPIDLNVSYDNPFFADGVPLYAPMPEELLDKLVQAGCTHAWKREQHKMSSLDVLCDSILLDDWLLRTPGGLVGATHLVTPNLDGVSPEGMTYDAWSDPMYIILASSRLPCAKASSSMGSWV